MILWKKRTVDNTGQVREITGGKLAGGSFGSTEISFLPSTLKAGNYSADTKSAGAVCLLAQIALPCAIFSPGEVCLQLCGGTNADMAPQIDEFTEIFLPNVSKFGFSFEFEVVKKGFFPKGGGHVNFFLTPVAYLKPINMVDVGKVTEVQGWSFTAGNLPVRLAERMAAACNAHLRGTFTFTFTSNNITFSQRPIAKGYEESVLKLRATKKIPAQQLGLGPA